MMQHHIEMCFKSYFFQWMLSRAYMCSVYLECIFRQPTQPTKDLRGKNTYFHVFFAIFPAEQTLQLLVLRVKVTRKKHI